ncbi:chromosome condensation protein CrcB [Glutamicibacter halophytocola]|uniref:fluoride efflux transporter CrcB n=1 Tax=Glutamicibacter halophytocola TaxID=1933880 RepID=UPI0006D4AC2C|nr:fluoride efflux transporter CrcB [Glutamicibacter halophytocola]ALG28658.1 chromosome condensation protein CrcB [Glutamicibacter halophytocola]
MMGTTPVLFALVAFCGGLGAVLRYGLDSFISAKFGALLPWGTITINVSGSFALGFLTGWLANTQLNEAWLLAMGTGVLGGYTTFSTASFDTLRLLRAGRPWSSLANALGTLLAAVLAAWGGYLLSSLL